MRSGRRWRWLAAFVDGDNHKEECIRYAIGLHILCTPHNAGVHNNLLVRCFFSLLDTHPPKPRRK